MMRHYAISGFGVVAAFTLSTVLWAQENSSGADALPAEGQPVADTGQIPPPPPIPGKVVYRSVDSKGQVTFTDSPPANRPSEAIRVQAANTMPSELPSAVGDDGSPRQEAPPVEYTLLAIVSPVNEEVLGQDVETVTLSAQLEPGLQSGHTFQLYYDGQPVGGGEMSYTVTELYRGTHTVEAKVFDSRKKVLKASEKVRFHVKRVSVLNKPKPEKLSSDPGPTLGEPLGGFGSPGGVPSSGGVRSTAGKGGAIGGAPSAGGAAGAGSSPKVRSK
jgi:hypothetical protein